MKQIHLVDDSNTMLLSLEGMLGKAGFGITSSLSGEEALTKLKNNKPNLVITDLNMPGMDGITLVKEIKKLSSMRFVPILLLTTESQQSKRDEARAAGATGWLVKPVKQDELIGVIKQLVPGA